MNRFLLRYPSRTLCSSIASLPEIHLYPKTLTSESSRVPYQDDGLQRWGGSSSHESCRAQFPQFVSLIAVSPVELFMQMRPQVINKASSRNPQLRHSSRHQKMRFLQQIHLLRIRLSRHLKESLQGRTVRTGLMSRTLRNGLMSRPSPQVGPLMGM